MNWNFGLHYNNTDSNNSLPSATNNTPSLVDNKNEQEEQEQEEQEEEFVHPILNEKVSYYNSFEYGNFPFFSFQATDPLWSTSTSYIIPSTSSLFGAASNNNMVWFKSNATCNTGLYSLQSPNFLQHVHSNNDGNDYDENERLNRKWNANVTLIMPDYDTTANGEEGGGTLYFSVWANVTLPFDSFEYYINGVNQQHHSTSSSSSSTAMPKAKFEQRSMQLGPGPQVIEFQYTFNPNNESVILSLDDIDDNGIHDRMGAVFIDDVYFIPADGNDNAPFQQPITGSPIVPSIIDSFVPTRSPTDDDRYDVSYAPTDNITSISNASSNLNGPPHATTSVVTEALEDNNSRQSNSNTISIGITCALIALLVLVALVYVLYTKRKRRRKEEQDEVSINE